MTRPNVPATQPGTTPPVLSSDASGDGRGGFQFERGRLGIWADVLIPPPREPGKVRTFINNGAPLIVAFGFLWALIGSLMWGGWTWAATGALAAAFIFTVTVWCVDDRETDRDAYLYAAAVTGAVGAVALVAAVVGVLVGRVA